MSLYHSSDMSPRRLYLDNAATSFPKPKCVIDAMTRYPELIERPVVIWADRAVIARPPELLLPLLEGGHGQAAPG